jgi:uncharacterized membrane protein (DUF485 family)
MPWSYYSVLLTFGIFFFSLNIYFFTKWLGHPLASDLWLVGAVVGFAGLVFSVHMVRVHQRELVRIKHERSNTPLQQ